MLPKGIGKFTIIKQMLFQSDQLLTSRPNQHLKNSLDGYTPFRILKCISFAFGATGNVRYFVLKS